MSGDEKPSDNTSLKRAIARGAVASVLYFSVLTACFAAWVHYFYAGSYSGPLMISAQFGVSEGGKAAGAEAIYPASIAGWDGQFYYTQSNDPLMLKEDYAHTKLFDLASYRYQRNGLPMMARIVSAIACQSYTSPLAYFLTQFAAVSVGLGILVGYLSYFGAHWAWALVWGLYGGVLRPMLHGLPDPTADTMLLVAMLAAASGQLILYAIAASILCLCRESYAAPAAVVWLLTISNAIAWKQYGYFARFALTSLPGAVVLGWAWYVAHQTGSEILAGSRSVAWGGLVDWPFFAFVRCTLDDLRAGRNSEAYYAMACAACIAVVLVLMIARVRRSRLTLAILPHVVLMAMTGWIVWEAGVGFFKNTSSVVLLGVVLLPFYKSRILRAVLIINLVAGLTYVYKVDWRNQQFLPPLPVQLASEQPIPITPITGEMDYASSLELVSIENLNNRPEYHGMFAWCHRDASLFKVRIKNESKTSWPATAPGADAVSVAVQLIDRGKVRLENRVSLPKTVAPGERVEVEFMAPRALMPTKSRIVRVGMVHDSHRWFSDGDDRQKIDIPN